MAAPTMLTVINQFKIVDIMRVLPERKDIRLKDYNYNQNGAYFITVCTKDRAELFGRIIVGAAIGRPLGITYDNICSK
ncbi:MAG: hypothetical protein FWD70_02410 [Desulfuromonadales bacterium]|nr:hypothetical protein [Desulfuromonadales bacterium]